MRCTDIAECEYYFRKYEYFRARPGTISIELDSLGGAERFLYYIHKGRYLADDRPAKTGLEELEDRREGSSAENRPMVDLR